MEVYDTYLDAIVNNAGIESEHIPFEYEMNVVKQNDQSYKYEIAIYNPQIAMYDVEMIAMDQNLKRSEYLFPCIGILGEDAQNSFNMIPYQSAPDKNYIRMMMLDSVSKEQPFTINVMVIWKDASLQNVSRVFFNCHYVEEKNESKQE